MSPIIEFVRARFAEDEAVAREAASGLIASQWWDKGEHGRVYAGHWVPVVRTTSYTERGEDPEDAVEHPGVGYGALPHIARHDPARVLAEVASKRLFLDLIFDYEARIDGEWGCGHGAEAIAAGECCMQPEDMPAVRALAAVYAGHEDYLEAWKS